MENGRKHSQNKEKGGAKAGAERTLTNGETEAAADTEAKAEAGTKTKAAGQRQSKTWKRLYTRMCRHIHVYKLCL